MAVNESSTVSRNSYDYVCVEKKIVNTGNLVITLLERFYRYYVN